MKRITKKQIENVFKHFCMMMNLRQATSWNDVGGFQLVKEMGYWKIEEIVSDGGGVRHTFGGGWTGRELIEAMRLVMTVEYYRTQI